MKFSKEKWLWIILTTRMYYKVFRLSHCWELIEKYYLKSHFPILGIG